MEHIDQHMSEHPDEFLGEAPLQYEILNVRQEGGNGYYNVGLRTNLEETHVVGVLGDGMVFYPFDWCTGMSRLLSPSTLQVIFV